MIRDGIGSCDEGRSRVGLGLSGGRARPVVVEWMGAAAVHPRCGGGPADETPHAPKSVGVPISPHKGICLNTHLSWIDAGPLSVGPPPYPFFLGPNCELFGKEDLGPVDESEPPWSKNEFGTPSEGGLCEMGPVGGKKGLKFMGREFVVDEESCRRAGFDMFCVDIKAFEEVLALGNSAPEPGEEKEGWLL